MKNLAFKMFTIIFLLLAEESSSEPKSNKPKKEISMPEDFSFIGKHDLLYVVSIGVIRNNTYLHVCQGIMVSLLNAITVRNCVDYW